MNATISIKSAAIRLGDMTIVEGGSHAMAIMTASLSGKVVSADLLNVSFESGFVTSEGEFVTREEAFRIAQAAGQCKASGDGRRLQSEHLAHV